MNKLLKALQALKEYFTAPEYRIVLKHNDLYYVQNCIGSLRNGPVYSDCSGACQTVEEAQIALDKVIATAISREELRKQAQVKTVVKEIHT